MKGLFLSHYYTDLISYWGEGETASLSDSFVMQQKTGRQRERDSEKKESPDERRTEMEPLILSVSHWRTFRVESRQRAFPPPPASLPRRRVHLRRQSTPLAACVQRLRNSRDYLAGFSCNLCRCNILIKHSCSLCSPTRVGALIEMFLLTFGPTVSLSFSCFACLNLESSVVTFIHKARGKTNRHGSSDPEVGEERGDGKLLV